MPYLMSDLAGFSVFGLVGIIILMVEVWWGSKPGYVGSGLEYVAGGG